ncbi:MAG: AmmeMemoRadiSam system radical SAM enzyme [bacterium]
MERDRPAFPISRREFLKGCLPLSLGLGFPQLFWWPFPKPVLPTKPSEASDVEANHEARYYRKLEGGKVNCQLCFRRCVVPDGGRGFCRNRENRGGTYYTLVYNRPCALQIDPITKEPAFHVLPGGTIFCTATASCNNRCKFCQNWHISQRSVEETPNYRLEPDEVVQLALDYRCDGMSFTFSEPTVFYEYMYDIAKIAKSKGLLVMYHTNGLINREPLVDLLQYMDSITVDLKAFTDEFYRNVCSSQLDPVLRTLKTVREVGTHLEVVNLVVPTLNDDMDDIRKMCIWIGENLGAETPLHFTRFFPQYKLTALPPTPVETLECAREIALEEGLHYVYIGNVPGHSANSTYCPRCQKLLIGRTHFNVHEINVEGGKCRFCGNPIPGIWGPVKASGLPGMGSSDPARTRY